MSINTPYQFEHYLIAASQTDAPIPGSAAGSYLHRIVVTVTDNSHGEVLLKHDSHDHVIVPANTGKGVYSVELNISSVSTGFSVTTGSASQVIAVGIFG
jgi:hypothetical protein